MHPVLFRIGSFEITTFGVMTAVAMAVGMWLFLRECRRAGLPEDTLNAALVGAVGGLIGAKVLWTLEHADQGPVLDLLLSRGGLSWYGGLVGGVGSGLAYVRWQRWAVVPILAAATPALAFGHLLGRIGCFLVGDDYGWPTTLPWGVAFPEGLPPTTARVHPTQLYEAIALGVLGVMLLRWRRSSMPDRVVLGRYFIGAAGIRFAIEFVRVHEPLALGLAPAHWLSLVVATLGVAFLANRSLAR